MAKKKIATVTFTISGAGLEGVAIEAADADNRAEAIERIQKALPAIELLESMLKEDGEQK
jgi:2-keto-4-pentenoate hydratase